MTQTTVTAVEALLKTHLRLRLSNDRTIEADSREYLREPGDELLRKVTFLDRAKASACGHGVSEPGDIIIAIDALDRPPEEQAGKARPTRKVNTRMQRRALSAAHAAKAPGLTR